MYENIINQNRNVISLQDIACKNICHRHVTITILPIFHIHVYIKVFDVFMLLCMYCWWKGVETSQNNPSSLISPVFEIEGKIRVYNVDYINLVGCVEAHVRCGSTQPTHWHKPTEKHAYTIFRLYIPVTEYKTNFETLCESKQTLCFIAFVP